MSEKVFVYKGCRADIRYDTERDEYFATIEVRGWRFKARGATAPAVASEVQAIVDRLDPHRR
ncbi:hypothetical protein EC912_103403 [Luteibacter rhizovicinus]|uniref:Uncharacterized protein n=1 Tax=Luteibacter rhizovicinus TaxID=242606 RepID=A0A4R3YR45_9GAMM|nr:hypothetical protein [Luteibacter rhizovicinus]TCV94910.1 hypothetical protein EC912_103403 [Luteibacter rhizovicinus]